MRSRQWARKARELGIKVGVGVGVDIPLWEGGSRQAHEVGNLALSDEKVSIVLS